MYKIIFVYNDNAEIIDTCENLPEATKLLSEYKTAFNNIHNGFVYLDSNN